MPLVPGRPASSHPRTIRPALFHGPARSGRVLATAVLAVVALLVLLAPVACSQSVGSGDGPVNPAPTTAADHFSTTRDGRILDPGGREFVALGANIGIQGVFDWGGTADGHVATARQWGWNTVRLNVLVADAITWSRVRAIGYDAFMDEIDAVVREYTDERIVVMIDSHDLFMTPGGERGVDAPYYEQINRFWRDAAQRYKDNPYVWFNLHNEPPVENQDWYEVHRRSAAAIRGTGALNPIVVDAPVWGQDLGEITPDFAGARFGHDSDMAPALAREFGTVILSQHNYGAYDVYTDPAAYGRYVDRVRAAGLPLIVGEFGMRTDGVEEWRGQTDHNRRAAHAVAEVHRTKRVGALWWHANHTDGWSLFRDDTAFWTHPPGTMLSEGGRVMWELRGR